MEQEFEKHVLNPFVEAYVDGRTPNPCLICNQYVKFSTLLDRAIAIGADRLATGHYAKISKDQTGRYYLEKGVDKFKDQSYFLFSLKQKELSRLMFPLGGFSKSQVREISEGFELSVASKKESQDVCFIANDYRAFIKKNFKEQKP